jgi:hypothetical protein
MYCRRCHYNLFGLPENRCPECGAPFDANDAQTFLKRPPGLIHRLTPRRSQLFLTLLLILFFAAELLGPRISGGEHVNLAFDRYNLMALTRSWSDVRMGPNYDAKLIPQDLTKYVGPSLSRRSDSAFIRARERWLKRASQWRSLSLALCTYSALMAFVSRMHTRRVFAVCAMIMLISLLVCRSPDLVADLLWPKSYLYLNDYTFLTQIDWSDPPYEAETVLAYEKGSWGGEGRAVAFVGSGDMPQVRMIDEQVFQRLAAEQDIGLPEPRRPDSAMKPTAESQ